MTVKKTGKKTFFIVVAFIAVFAVTSIMGIDKLFGDTRTTYVKGVDDIRLGIDIKGGVDVTFGPADDFDADKDQLASATEVIKKSGSFFSYGDTKLGQGRDKVKEVLTDNPDLCEELEAKISEQVKEMGLENVLSKIGK